jgi:hypothetical protein
LREACRAGAREWLTALAAINAVAVAGGALMNVKFTRLWSDDDVTAIRKKRKEIEGA